MTNPFKQAQKLSWTVASLLFTLLTFLCMQLTGTDCNFGSCRCMLKGVNPFVCSSSISSRWFLHESPRRNARPADKGLMLKILCWVHSDCSSVLKGKTSQSVTFRPAWRQSVLNKAHTVLLDILDDFYAFCFLSCSTQITCKTYSLGFVAHFI